MRNLIIADIDRILRKKSLWILLAVSFLFAAAGVYGKISSSPDRSLAFTVAAANGVGFAGFLVGIVLVLNVYADDFKSMTFISVIGRGISRKKLIIARFLDTFLILSNMYLLSGLFVLALKLAFRVTLSPDMGKYIVLAMISDILCTSASVVIAAAFFFLTENTTLGIIAYLNAEVIFPIALEFVSVVPAVAKYHPERYYFYGAASCMMTDFLLGVTGDGLLKLLLIIVVYMIGAGLATILLFKRKELEF